MFGTNTVRAEFEGALAPKTDCAHCPSFINAEYGLAYSELEGSSAVHSTFRQKAKLLLFVLDKKQNFCFLSNGRKQNFCFLSNGPNVLFTIAENNFSDPRVLRQNSLKV
jgi:hypothetical protein